MRRYTSQPQACTRWWCCRHRVLASVFTSGGCASAVTSVLVLPAVPPRSRCGRLIAGVPAGLFLVWWPPSSESRAGVTSGPARVLSGAAACRRQQTGVAQGPRLRASPLVRDLRPRQQQPPRGGAPLNAPTQPGWLRRLGAHGHASRAFAVRVTGGVVTGHGRPPRWCCWSGAPVGRVVPLPQPHTTTAAHATH